MFIIKSGLLMSLSFDDVYFPISAWAWRLAREKGLVRGRTQTGRRFTAFAEQNKPR